MRVRNAFAARPVNERELDEAVRELVDALKRQGAPVERIIVGIKRLAEAAAEDNARIAAPSSPPDQRRRLIENAVKCCIEHYYAT